MKPPYLKKGDLVGIIAPARWVDPEDVAGFLGLLHEEGYHLLSGSIHARLGQFAGDDQTRLNDLQSMFDHPGIRAIFCARGGYGSIRLLKELKLDEFSRNPKWLVGYSDITALHCLVQGKLKCESLHALMPYSIRKRPERSDPGVTSLLEMLRGKMPEYHIEPGPMNRSGTAEGILMGGNLSVLYSLTGTPFQPDTRDAILFLEDVDEYLYHIDRMMQNLKLSGMLSGLKGLVVGGMTGMHDNEVPFGSDPVRIIREAVNAYDYPVLFNFPAGHTDPNMALVLGRMSRLSVNKQGGRLRF